MSESSNTGFGLATLMNEIERTAKGALGSAAETILGDPGSCDRVSFRSDSPESLDLTLDLYH